MKKIILKIIRVYQRAEPTRRAVLGSILPLKSSCRFSPTCSEYTYQAVKKYGALKGLVLGVRRAISCNPFSTFGYKPLK